MGSVTCLSTQIVFENENHSIMFLFGHLSGKTRICIGQPQRCSEIVRCSTVISCSVKYVVHIDSFNDNIYFVQWAMIDEELKSKLNRMVFMPLTAISVSIWVAFGLCCKLIRNS